MEGPKGVPPICSIYNKVWQKYLAEIYNIPHFKNDLYNLTSKYLHSTCCFLFYMLLFIFFYILQLLWTQIFIYNKPKNYIIQDFLEFFYILQVSFLPNCLNPEKVSQAGLPPNCRYTIISIRLVHIIDNTYICEICHVSLIILTIRTFMLGCLIWI